MNINGPTHTISLMFHLSLYISPSPFASHPPPVSSLGKNASFSTQDPILRLKSLHQRLPSIFLLPSTLSSAAAVCLSAVLISAPCSCEGGTDHAFVSLRRCRPLVTYRPDHTCPPARHTHPPDLSSLSISLLLSLLLSLIG